MAHVPSMNYVRDTTNVPDTWCVIWRAICCMIKAGWQVLASSDGTTKVGAATILTQNLVTLTNVGAGGSSFTVGAKENSTFMTLTGLSGLVVPTVSDPGSEGNFLTMAGCTNAGNNGTFQIVEVLSTTSCKIRNTAGVASDTGTTWQEKSVTVAAYVPATWSAKAPWIVLAGPKTVKVPVTVAPTLTVGEDVIQGAGATQRRGKLVNFVFGTSSGWLVIDPCDDGTWDTTTITGVSSAQTQAVSATPVTYQVQYVFAKNSANYSTGYVAWQHYDIAGENTQAFSFLAANNANVTATQAPGFEFSGTGTSFPLTGIVHVGAVKNSAVALASGFNTFFGGNSLGQRAQILVANCLTKPLGATAARAADGSFVLAISSTQVAGAFQPMISFQRLDECERGEVSPYVSLAQANNTSSTFNRFFMTPDTGSTFTLSTLLGNVGTTYMGCRGYAGRGTTRDTPSNFNGFFMKSVAGDFDVYTANQALNMREVSHPDAAPPLRREHICMSCDGAVAKTESGVLYKMIKGRCRWFASIGIGDSYSTYDAGLWMSIATFGTTTRSIIVGPTDTVTNPTS